jgi:16S rRNA (guanine966-N2)-methyltransferase
MKVIKGILKNRSLLIPPHIRPLSLRVKKSLFDIMRDQIEGSTILDLFSGSGSMGIEAISLGAESVTFVDIKKACVTTIQKNLSALKVLPKGRLVLKDAFQAIRNFAARGEKFDIIFSDPPYYKGFTIKILQTLDEYDIVSPHGYIILTCYDKDETGDSFSRFSKISSKHYGQTVIVTYQKKDETGVIPGNF